MNFTSKIKRGPLLSGILTIVVAGWIGWGSHAARMPGATEPAAVAAGVQIIPAVQVTPERSFEATGSNYYLPVASWYHNKHWWKRNTPIVVGAGGGALVGGLIGGGTGAIVGGAVGGGGGYLYKRSRHHHYHHEAYDYHHHH
jgi:hypothetical protein